MHTTIERRTSLTDSYSALKSLRIIASIIIQRMRIVCLRTCYRSQQSIANPKKQYLQKAQIPCAFCGLRFLESPPIYRTALSTESAALSIESPPIYRMAGFLGIARKRSAFYRKRKFLESAEHIYNSHI